MMRGIWSMLWAALALVISACTDAPKQEPEVSAPGDRIATEQARGRSLSDVSGDSKAALSWTPLEGSDDAGRAPSQDRFGQPLDERAAQQALPQSPDKQWAVLATTVIGEDLERGIFTARHPPRVRALAGRAMTIRGYVMPLETTPTFSHFLLTRYTPVCNFCPPGAPNEVIEVIAATPLAPTQNLVEVSGPFAIANNGEQGLFFRIEGALVQPKS
jgi:hypothetical protein